jgi:hypothetical protein
MKRSIDILLGDDARIEHESRGARERAAFEYSPEWLGARDRFSSGRSVPIAVIRRFDRTPGGGRIPYVSAATLMGADLDLRGRGA